MYYQNSFTFNKNNFANYSNIQKLHDADMKLLKIHQNIKMCIWKIKNNFFETGKRSLDFAIEA